MTDTFLGTEHTIADNKGNGPVQLEIYILFLMHYDILKILTREYMVLFTILTDSLGNCVREWTKREQEDKSGGSETPRRQVTVDQHRRLAETR